LSGEELKFFGKTVISAKTQVARRGKLNNHTMLQSQAGDSLETLKTVLRNLVIKCRGGIFSERSTPEKSTPPTV